uniref:Protein croquemort n=1 Tax=Clastoptera arizonana TaxID=38151 RepID=A0A1B6DPX8_9HEMI
MDHSQNTRPGRMTTALSIGKCCGDVLLLSCGGMALVFGLYTGIAWPFIFNKILQSNLALTQNATKGNNATSVLAMWEETPMPIYMEVYMFNWTNPATSLHGPDKPKFVEMGPYVFYEHHSKGNLTWNSNNTITYLNKKTWKFMPELSNGSLSDNITNINVVAMAVGNKCRNLNPILKSVVSMLIDVEETLVVTHSVGNLLFDGTTDRLLKIADILKNHSINIPLQYDKFGWFYKRNNSFTTDGVFTMNTGKDDINKLGLLTNWNYKNTTSGFTGDCAKVQGTYGELFPPNSASLRDIKLFANDLCSVLTLNSESSVVIQNLTGIVFNGTGMFSNKTTCYCPKGVCPASGIRDVSACKGAPVAISFPHFYDADASYRDAIDGMEPDGDKHSFTMVLEQVTSIPLKVNARLQLNLLMDTIPGMPFYKNLKKTYIPMLWFTQRATITPAMASNLSSLTMVSYYAPFIMFGVATLGAILVTLGLFLRSRSCCQEEHERLLD